MMPVVGEGQLKPGPGCFLLYSMCGRAVVLCQRGGTEKGKKASGPQLFKREVKIFKESKKHVVCRERIEKYVQ